MATKKRTPGPSSGKILVQRRPTAVLRKQSWVVKVVFSNGKTFGSSEKYARHIDALEAANLLAAGNFEVVDELAS